jgi:Holliday junction resolvase
MNPSKRKGDRAERELATILSDLTGYDVRRALGAGRKEDTGDAFGLPGAVIQIADWKDVIRAVREKPLEAEAQRLNAHVGLAWTFVRLRGGVWRAVQTPEQMCATYLEATA